MSKTTPKKQDPIATLIDLVETGLCIDDIDNFIECQLEEKFDKHYTRGELDNFQAAKADARQYQDITEADVAKHPAFVSLVKRLAHDIAKGARKQSLEFQLQICSFDEE